MGSMAGSFLRTGRLQRLGRNHAGCAHHVENPRCEPAQQTYDHPPGRNPEPAIERPADGCADDDSGDELAGESKSAGDRRRITGATRSLTLFGGGLGTDVAQAVTETTESSGERSLIDRRLVTIIRFARVVGHAFDTRDDWGCDRGVPSPSRPRGPYALPQGVSRIGAGAVSLCDCDTLPGFGRQ